MRCFSVYSDEIAGRLDPLYYYSDAFQVLKKSGFTIKTIGDVISYIKTGFPAGSNSQLRNKQGIIQIRPTNINKDNLLVFEKNIYIKPDIAEKRKEDVIKKREILFNNTNSQELVGKTAYFDLEGNYFCSNHITRIKVKEDIILPKYLWILLNLYQRNKVFFNLCTNWNNQSGVNIELLKRIKIPIPSIKEQEKIIVIYEKGLNAKKSKESEAQQLLDSINDYVLSELGIKLPELKDEMTFVVYSNDIKDRRIDPYYYQPKFEEIKKAINKGMYEVKELKEITDKLLSGQRPKGGIKQIDMGIPSLGGEHVLSDGTIATDNLKFISMEFHKKQLKSKVQKKDIIIVKDGATTGKVGIIPEDYPFEEANINEHVFLLRVKNEANPYFIFSFLKSKAGQTQINRDITGGTVTGIIRETTEQIKIPLPTLEIQNKIAEEVKRRMKKAEQLQKEAKEELEKAKAEVEKIILDET